MFREILICDKELCKWSKRDCRKCTWKRTCVHGGVNTTGTPLSHEHHSLYLSIHQTSHSSLQRSLCSPSSEGMEQQDFWNLPASRWDLSPRFREKACPRGACREWWEKTAAPASGLHSQPPHLPHPNKLLIKKEKLLSGQLSKYYQV